MKKIRPQIDPSYAKPGLTPFEGWLMDGIRLLAVVSMVNFIFCFLILYLVAK